MQFAFYLAVDTGSAIVSLFQMIRSPREYFAERERAPNKRIEQTALDLEWKGGS